MLSALSQIAGRFQEMREVLLPEQLQSSTTLSFYKMSGSILRFAGATGIVVCIIRPNLKSQSSRSAATTVCTSLPHCIAFHLLAVDLSLLFPVLFLIASLLWLWLTSYTINNCLLMRKSGAFIIHYIINC